ncbi:hypothetical protein [Deinococcus cellulosilyticus]|nr:hypothetical protein [Deinococcus cellulosilyticus]
MSEIQNPQGVRGSVAARRNDHTIRGVESGIEPRRRTRRRSLADVSVSELLSKAGALTDTPEPQRAAPKAEMTGYPFLLATALRNSQWKISQVILTNTMDCKSPDPDRTLQVAKWTILERDFLRILHNMQAQDVTKIREYLWYEKNKWDADTQKHVSVQPDWAMAAAAFEDLWASLRAYGCLKRIRD